MDFLDFIAEAEGTANQPDPYSVVLGYGLFGSPDRPLTEMTLDEVYDFGRQMLAHPDNNFNSSAVGRYQIVGNTLRDLQARLNLPGSTLYSAAVQDRMAHELIKRRGNNPDALRNEWQGLEKYDDATIMKAIDGVYNGDVEWMLRPMPNPRRGGAMPPLGLRQLSSRQAGAEQTSSAGNVFLPHEHMQLASVPELYSRAQNQLRGQQ